MEDQKALFGRFDALWDEIQKGNQDTILMAYNLVSESSIPSYSNCASEILSAYYYAAREGTNEKLEAMCKKMEDTLTLNSKVRNDFYNSKYYNKWLNEEVYI